MNADGTASPAQPLGLLSSIALSCLQVVKSIATCKVVYAAEAEFLVAKSMHSLTRA